MPTRLRGFSFYREAVPQQSPGPRSAPWETESPEINPEKGCTNKQRTVEGKFGCQMRFKYHDKLDISFVDFTSMVVMQDLGISEVFTGDAHFR